METAYAIKDDAGNGGQSISFTQGETRLVTLYMFLANGLPRVVPGTISTAVIKIFSMINQASIQKTLAASQVTLIAHTGADVGTVGVQFALASADTAMMAPNNSGLPMKLTLTDSSSNTYEFDFLSLFNVSVPVVQT